MFIMKCSNQKYDSEKIIADSSAVSHMVTTDENMTKICDAEIRVTVVNSGTLNRAKYGNWHGYHKHDIKIHHVTLSDAAALPGQHKKLI